MLCVSVSPPGAQKCSDGGAILHQFSADGWGSGGPAADMETDARGAGAPTGSQTAGQQGCRAGWLWGPEPSKGAAVGENAQMWGPPPTRSALVTLGVPGQRGGRAGWQRPKQHPLALPVGGPLGRPGSGRPCDPGPAPWAPPRGAPGPLSHRGGFPCVQQHWLLRERSEAGSHAPGGSP